MYLYQLKTVMHILNGSKEKCWKVLDQICISGTCDAREELKFLDLLILRRPPVQNIFLMLLLRNLAYDSYLSEWQQLYPSIYPSQKKLS